MLKGNLWKSLNGSQLTKSRKEEKEKRQIHKQSGKYLRMKFVNQSQKWWIWRKQMRDGPMKRVQIVRNDWIILKIKPIVQIESK